MLGGGRLRPIVCISKSSSLLLTAASTTTTTCRSQPSLLLHPLPVGTILHSFRTIGPSNLGPASVCTFAIYTARPRSGIVTTACFRRSFAIQPTALFHSFRMASTLALPKFPIFEAISRHDPNSTAVAHCLSGRSFKYGELLPDVCRARDQIHAAVAKTDIRGERIAFLVENSYDYVGTQAHQRRILCRQSQPITY